MGVTIELQNLGDAELCREIIARIEHAFSDKPGEWRVSIAGSRASENWILKLPDRTPSSGRILCRVLPGGMSLTQYAD
jgi:hypothetical protein